MSDLKEYLNEFHLVIIVFTLKLEAEKKEEHKSSNF